MNNIIYAGYPADDESKFHNHKGYEIKLCSCVGKIETATEQYILNSGDFVVVPLLLKHRYTNANTESGFSGDSEHGGNLTGGHAGASGYIGDYNDDYVSGGNGDYADDYVSGRNYTDGKNLTVILEQALLPIKEVTVIPSAKAYGLKETFYQAEYYFNNGQSERSNILSALGELIAAYITAYSSDKKFSPVVNTIMAEIDKNLSTAGFSLDGFLRTLPLNYDYVRKLFKKEVGLTPHDYLTNSRMELAKTIMISGVSNQYSSYTISQIAEMCGFTEPLYFSRVFKKYFGISPSEYYKL
jgi:AraC-like DNA-binding protein